MTDPPQVTPASTVTDHPTIIYTFPAHEPRTSDPHYAAFNRTRAALEKAGKLACWIANADCGGGPIELHHNIVEFSLANIVDATHFAQLYPQYAITDEETFLEWVETDPNLLPLCPIHHRGVLGIHSIHYPAWLVQRFMLTAATDPERTQTAQTSAAIA